MSCNGCRVLRKGCSDACVLRSSLLWIESPEAQGHATVFVAKFFGRAAMMSFISAVAESQRSALFQSLLYEACGRTVNPVFGAVGLLWSGNWGLCQAAVETVLKGGSLRPAAVLSSRPAQSAACKSDLPLASSQPTISFNPFLQLPPCAQPALPPKRARLCAPQQQEEVSNITAETACRSPDRPDGAICKPLGHHASCNLPSAPCAPLHAPVPRRANPIQQSLSFLPPGMLQDQALHDNVEGPRSAVNSSIQLDLTLSSHGDHADVGTWANSLPFLMRVSSPSSFSVNSEGSVTNSDTAEYIMSRLTTPSAQAHHHAEDVKLLHLL